MITSLHFIHGIFAINDFGKYSGAGSFTYSPRPRKQKSMGKMISLKRIFKRFRNMILPDHIIKSGRSVLAGRDNKITHADKL